MSQYLPLFIPVENQVRELDPKLLLAVTAAKTGMRSYIGYRTEMDIMISRLPRGIYLAKSFTQRSDKMFRILSKLGHIICAWDEEALVHYPPDIYFTRRLSATALGYVSHLFAWGKENEDLFNAYPELPKNLPIHQVGNPRLDLLREQFAYFYHTEIENIQQEYGKFILINTNFGNVNAHLPYLNLFTNQDERGNYQHMGRGATGMGREYAEGRAKFKQTIFEHFLTLIPRLADSFKDINIIIRPHPVENKQPYYDLAANYKNVQVVQQGNVIPWIRAASTLIHSGCTTGIEAFLSSSPAIAYVPVTEKRFGYDADLPNQLSHCCYSQSDVIKMVENTLNLDLPPLDSSALHDYVDFHQDTLCCSKIVDCLRQIDSPKQAQRLDENRTHGWILANKRRLIKRIKSLSSASKYHRSFQQVRFPTLNEAILRDKINAFAKALDMDTPPTIKQVSPHIFLVQ